MKNKIVGIIVCTLLISCSTTLALTPLNTNTRHTIQQLMTSKQNPSPLIRGWIKTFGGEDIDWGHSVQQTIDGGYIIAGATNSSGAGWIDVWVIKTDSNGKKLWDATFGGSSEDWGFSVQQTSDEGFIITGYTFSYGAGGEDVWLIKTDGDGNEEWNKTFGSGGTDVGCYVQETSDNGFIITGYTYSDETAGLDVLLIKTDDTGNLIWERTFAVKTWGDVGRSVQQTIDGGYIIGGFAWDHEGFYDVLMIKTDGDGNHQWNKTYGGTGKYDVGWTVQQTTDTGYIITGYTETYGAGWADVWLIKTDTDGTEQWNTTYGGTKTDSAYCVRQTTDGGYIILGYTTSNTNLAEQDVFLIKTDATGETTWERTIGGITGEEGECVQQTNDGGYIIVGFKDTPSGDRDVLLIKTNSEGLSKTLVSNNPWFVRFLERHPNAFPILRHLLGY